LRVNLLKGESGMEKESSILIDQLRAIDNKRLMKKIGTLHDKKIQIIKNSISRILDLDY
jgi:mRNA interferase MazF